MVAEPVEEEDLVVAVVEDLVVAVAHPEEEDLVVVAAHPEEEDLVVVVVLAHLQEEAIVEVDIEEDGNYYYYESYQAKMN